MKNTEKCLELSVQQGSTLRLLPRSDEITDLTDPIFAGEVLIKEGIKVVFDLYTDKVRLVKANPQNGKERGKLFPFVDRICVSSADNKEHAFYKIDFTGCDRVTGDGIPNITLSKVHKDILPKVKAGIVE